MGKIKGWRKGELSLLRHEDRRDDVKAVYWSDAEVPLTPNMKTMVHRGKVSILGPGRDMYKHSGRYMLRMDTWPRHKGRSAFFDTLHKAKSAAADYMRRHPNG